MRPTYADIGETIASHLGIASRHAWKELSMTRAVTRHLKKAELHCHIEGAASPALVLAQARKYNADTSSLHPGWRLCLDAISPRSCMPMMLPPSCSGPRRISRCWQRPISRNWPTAARSISEIFVSPDHGVASGLGAEAYIHGLAEGMQPGKGQNPASNRRMIVIGVRHLGPEQVTRRRGLPPVGRPADHRLQHGRRRAHGIMSRDFVPGLRHRPGCRPRHHHSCR